MTDTNVFVYTMKGCPFCTQFKEMLEKEGISFYERDIDEYNEEYDMFSEITESDLLPALLILTGENEDYESHFYVPEKDYDELTEAIEIIKSHM